jgi:hypothetical protein
MENDGLKQTEFSDKHFGDMGQSQEQTIKNIKELQEMEKNLYRKLDTSVAGEAVSKSEANRIVRRIDEISTLRQNLFKSLKNMYSLLRNNVSSSRRNLVNDMTNIGIVESELKNAKAQIQVLQTEKNNKTRMVEINKYYSSNYENHSEVMKIIIFTCIPIILFAALGNREIISSYITTILISISLGIGLIFLFFKIKDIAFRDNMNYDEYAYNKVSGISKEDDDDSSSNPWDSRLSVNITNKKWDDKFGCFGQDCCADGTSFNSDTNKCEILNNSGSASETASESATGSASGSLNETMISGDLTKYSLNDNNFDNVILPNNSVVVPFSDKHNFTNV